MSRTISSFAVLHALQLCQGAAATVSVLKHFCCAEIFFLRFQVGFDWARKRIDVSSASKTIKGEMLAHPPHGRPVLRTAAEFLAGHETASSLDRAICDLDGLYLV